MRIDIVQPTEPHLVRPSQRIFHDGAVVLVDEVRLRLGHAEIATRPEGRAAHTERKGKTVATKRDILRVPTGHLVDVMVDSGTDDLLAFKIADHLGESYTLILNGEKRVVSRGKDLLDDDEPTPPGVMLSMGGDVVFDPAASTEPVTE